MRTLEELAKEHEKFIHAIQTGNMYDQQINPKVAEYKHIRTGVDAALAGIDMITEILELKGLATQEEMLTRWNANLKRRILDREATLTKHYGAKITLH